MAFVKAGLWGPHAIIDSTGHPQPGATATVYLTDGVTLASLWTSSAKSVAMSNPTQADVHGNLHFWTDPGPYMLKVTVATVVTWLDVEVPIDPGEAAQDQDVTAAIATAEAYADGAAAAALAAALAGSQPLDADLTAIAALSTTAYGRAFLALADAAAGRTALGLGTAATHAVGDFDAAGAAAAAAAALVNSAPGTLDTLNELATALADDPAFATTMTNALAGKQPLDADLTAIAALSTTAFGRSALALADSTALRVLAGTVIGTDVQAHDADLDAIAALSTTAFGRALLVLADAAALRTAAGLGTAATAATTDFDAAGTASAAITALINGAPAALDTLNELATALGDDAAFATTVTNALATKLIAGATSGTANQAALPAAVAHTHEVVKTDDGGVYVSTGSSWVQLVPPAGTYAPASGIAESAVTNLVTDLAAKFPILVPTAVKTSNYTAAAGDLVLCDTSGGIFTVTLPTAPADKTSIAVDLITSGNTLTVARGGADVFQKASGATSLTMNTANRVLVLQYQTATGVWHVQDHLPAVITTKGDLLTYSTERVRLGVGTDGLVLTADSTQTVGLKWAPAAAVDLLDISPYVTAGAGQSQATRLANRAGIASAIAAAIAAKKGLYDPGLTVEIEFDSTNHRLDITGCHVVGAGSDLSNWKFFPNQPTFAYSGLFISAGGSGRVRGLKLTGPADPGSFATNGASITSGSAVVTFPAGSPISSAMIGGVIIGASGIVTGTVLSVNPGALQVTMAANATGTITGTAQVRISGFDVLGVEHAGGSYRRTNAAMNSGTKIITSTSAAFDVNVAAGMYLSLAGAGANTGDVLYAKIVSVDSATQITVDRAAGTTVSANELVIETGGGYQLDDVVVDGWWTVGLQNGDGFAGTQAVVRDCDIQAVAQGVNGAGNPNAKTRKFLKFYRTKFRGKGNTWGWNQDHLNYTGLSTSLWYEDCEWYDSPGAGYCLQHFSASGTQGARYGTTFVRDYVDESCTNGHLFNNQSVTTVQGGMVRSTNQGYLVRHNTLVSNVYFDRVASAVVPGSGAADDTICELKGCYWEKVSTIAQVPGNANSIMRIVGGYSLGGAFDVTNSTSGLLDLTGGFTHEGATAAYKTRDGTAVTAQNGIRMQQGRLRMSNVETKGAFATGSASVSYIFSAADTWTGEVDNCDFRHTGVPTLLDRNSAGVTNKVAMRNCFYASDTIAPKGKSGVQYQNCTPRRNNGGDLASAATLNASLNFDSYTITGTTEIDRILMHNTVDTNAACVGTRLYLRPTNASGVTFGHNVGGVVGRIVCKSGANTAVAQNAIFVVELGADEIWYQIS